MRVCTWSWSSASVPMRPVGSRLMKISPGTAPSPIFSAMRKRPVGVLLLPGSLPRPKREVEMT